MLEKPMHKSLLVYGIGQPGKLSQMAGIMGGVNRFFKENR
jgi:hypothetical protein